jgi:hypothetical protein
MHRLMKALMVHLMIALRPSPYGPDDSPAPFGYSPSSGFGHRHFGVISFLRVSLASGLRPSTLK